MSINFLKEFPANICTAETCLSISDEKSKSVTAESNGMLKVDEVKSYKLEQLNKLWNQMKCAMKPFRNSTEIYTEVKFLEVRLKFNFGSMLSLKM